MSRLLRLVRKELSESLRDRRTILTLVLMPLLLYPVMGVLLRQAVLGAKADEQGPEYRVGFASKEEMDSLAAFWGMGLRERARRSPALDGKDAPDHLRPEPKIGWDIVPDAAAALREERIDAAVRIDPRTPLRLDAARPPSVEVGLSWEAGSANGAAAAAYLEALTAESNAFVLSSRARARGVRLHVAAVPAAGPKRSSLVPVLVPLVLILMTMTGAVYPAIDTTAGERERGTLEILAAAPIPRLSVLLAKYAAVLVVALLTALVNLGTMAVTLHVTGLGEALFAGSFTWAVLGQVLALLVLFAAFFSAVLLALTSFARSFKEAQAYLIPLMLLCLAPGVMALLPGLSLKGPLAAVPLLNIVLLARDVFDGSASLATAGMVVVLTLLYALAALALAARVFATEAVVSESSGWGDFLRRPLGESAQAPGSSAMLCLALLFPATFLVSAALKGVEPLPLRLVAGGLAQAGLFAGFPLLAAWLGRVRWTTGLRLRVAPALAWPAAVLLSAGLWPLVHEAVRLAERAGFSSLPAEVRERLKDNLDAWRGVAPLLLVLALGVLPAVTEELLFRGYLFAAIEGGPVRKIASTAFLFAAFHLFVGDVLAVERLVPSLLMGLALGGLAWASGSVWPGMLLHAAHNTMLLLAGVNEPALREAGWLAGDGVAGVVLLGGALAAATGGLLAWRIAPRR